MNSLKTESPKDAEVSLKDIDTFLGDWIKNTDLRWYSYGVSFIIFISSIPLWYFGYKYLATLSFILGVPFSEEIYKFYKDIRSLSTGGGKTS